MRSLRTSAFVLVTALVPIAAGLVIAEIAARYIMVTKQYNFYLPLELNPRSIDSALGQFARTFDADLGWEPTSDNVHGYIGPERDSSTAVLSLFGDSFTQGYPDPEKSWAVQLEKRLGRPVLNFGVAGYGTDQAYLRFEKRYASTARTPYVFLGVLSENIARILNRYRGFYFRKTYLNGVKPRFVLGPEKNLRLVPTPIRSAQELPRLLDPAFRDEIGASDYWYQYYERYGLNRTIHFPYCYFLARAMPFYIQAFRAKRMNNDSEYKILYRDPEACALLEAIILRFVDRVSEQGGTPIVMFFPGWKDLADRATGRPVVYEEFRERLRSHGFAELDAMDYFAPSLAAGAAVGDFFRSYEDGHYNEKGEEIIAAGLFHDLQEIDKARNLLAPRSSIEAPAP